ncbi:spore germination protein KC [Halobacillus karajensis]|uniref:Ger(x)C family spore germination protein n=1 Tax=Halobacillus karajensis TaxID=195088 RepID=UPI0008A73F2A|nr:Ger(x)C family spore germination protein [Halobacillus karajensis]SEI04299.1 spore germination protein KC [Halobacillus karajensis]
MKKMKANKRIRLFHSMILLVALLTLTGCWSSDEINNLSTITLIGIDENDTGEVEVTAVIVKPHTLFAETAVDGSEQSKFLIETTTGESIFDAVSDLSSTTSERIYFGHVNAIVFGERAARKRMVSSLDFFKRETDFRPNTNVLVARGKASQLVQATPHLNVTLGMELEDLVLSNKYSETDMVEDVTQFMKDLSSDTKDPTTGIISSAKRQGVDIHLTGAKNHSDTKKKEEEPSTNTQENSQLQIPEAISLKETAVFKDGKLKGILDERETRGALLVKGKLKNEVVVLSCGSSPEETISLNITNSASKLTPQFSAGAPHMAIGIQVEAEIGQLACPDFNVDPGQIDRLNQQLESLVKQEVTRVLNKAKNQWQTDIFGFGQEFYRKYPKEWKQMAPVWRNGMLKNMKVDLSVSANISRHGLLKDPIKDKEGK